jgi:hypothetical protein
MTSSVGALVLGIGVGAFMSTSLGSLAAAVFFAGVALHALGTWDQHRIDARIAQPEPAWSKALFWLCWMLFVVVLIWFGMTRLA